MKKYFDLRDPMDYEEEHLPDAILANVNLLPHTIHTMATKEDEILLYCYSGNRSGVAAALLQAMGYHAKSIGGFDQLKGKKW